MLSSVELDEMRATIEEALPDTCTIQRFTSTSDGGGGTIDDWTDLATDVACGIAPVAGGEGGQLAGSSTIGNRTVEATTHIVTLPAGQDVTEADRIVVDAVTYTVTLVRRRAAWELSRRVEVKEA